MVAVWWKDPIRSLGLYATRYVCLRFPDSTLFEFPNPASVMGMQVLGSACKASQLGQIVFMCDRCHTLYIIDFNWEWILFAKMLVYEARCLSAKWRNGISYLKYSHWWILARHGSSWLYVARALCTDMGKLSRVMGKKALDLHRKIQPQPAKALYTSTSGEVLPAHTSMVLQKLENCNLDCKGMRLLNTNPMNYSPVPLHIGTKASKPPRSA